MRGGEIFDFDFDTDFDFNGGFLHGAQPVGWGEPENPNNSDRLRWSLRARPNMRLVFIITGDFPQFVILHS